VSSRLTKERAYIAQLLYASSPGDAPDKLMSRPELRTRKKPPRAPDVPAKPLLAAKTLANPRSRAADTSSAQALLSASGDPNFMTTLARGLAVIQAFSQKRNQLSISQISKLTGLSRASVRRCLYTLSKLGFAGSDDASKFFLRPKVLALGYAYLSSMPLAAAAQPVLEHVSHFLRESCSISTLDGTDIIYLARANVTRIMAIDLGIGSRLPAFCTSMGRVLLANLPPQQLEPLLQRIEFVRYTDRTVNSIERLRQILQGVRTAGYAVVDQELELGLRSMAVPIQSPSGQVVAALNVGAHAQRVTVQVMMAKFLPQLRAAAQELSLLS
jgi:IclR family pca regulon transcriptional regulator